MKVLFASAEVAPYSKTGGLADVAGALPLALSPSLEHISVITPLYQDIDQTRFSLIPIGQAGQVRLGADLIPYQLYKDGDIENNLEVIFIENEELFGRKGIYTTPDGEGFSDNNQRFFFFQLVILDLLKSGRIEADILHCNDHHTGLLPALIKFYAIKISTIFTIHNFLYHGHFGYEDEMFLPSGFMDSLHKTQWGNFSALLSALDEADLINTVSPGYAKELLAGNDLDTNSFAHVLAAGDRLSGIVNGIDTSYWNPELDTLIPFNYTEQTLDRKKLNKLELLKQCGLDQDLERPLIGLVSRLVENKGFPLIVQVVGEMVKLGACFVFLGSGDPKIVEQLNQLQILYPESVAFQHGYNEPMAHLIEAGSDLFLMPSRFEPCGLNQLYSLQYGTVPLVNRTGGLSDTVTEYSEAKGTGFLMNAYDLGELRSAMHRAINLFKDTPRWLALTRRGMAQDWSWDSSAADYIKLYKSIERRGHEEV